MSALNEQLLRDPEVFTDEAVLESALGPTYTSLAELFDAFKSDALAFSHEWRFYNDGKAWLCRVTFKKKTVCWISVWDGYFKISFYFTDKTKGGVDALNISSQIKRDFAQSEHVGRLIPLIVDVNEHQQLPDVLAIAQYKKTKL